MSKVFLGGTIGSEWRDAFIPELKIDYFNPVVENWTQECKDEELKQRENCDYVLYVITPSMTGVYSIAEVVDDSNKRPDRTLFCVINYEMGDSEKVNVFNDSQIESLESVKDMVKKNGAKVFEKLKDVIQFLNKDNNE